MLQRKQVVSTPAGKREIDHAGSPVGVVKLDANAAYSGTGGLLAEFIIDSNLEAWNKIRSKIDYTYQCLDLALAPLDKQAGFSQEIKTRVSTGQKLLFKPNLVNPMCIDPQTHQPGGGFTTCTAWPFIAALMRWFHDKLDISYHMMSIGEAATALAASAANCSFLQKDGKRITTEAIIEGKADAFHGGWGFYFVRKYLAETHTTGHKDNPYSGYEESVRGQYIPPGLVNDKLMVYDLNRLNDDPSKGREIAVPDGVNFKSITLHKAIVGGDPGQKQDLVSYPGCVLINVPKLKVHIMTILTNVIKNLGIGLYPMQCATAGECQWDYAIPHSPVPGIKGGIPHQVWVPEIDEATGLPVKSKTGEISVRKTGGINATMADIIKAVMSQNIYMFHVVDGIEAINHDHQGMLPGTIQAEGMVFAGTDVVATELLSARYLFSNIPLAEAEKCGIKDNAGGLFAQRVPVPTIENNQIVTKNGYDCPLARDRSFLYAEQRGLGKRQYYAMGADQATGDAIVSIGGRLGAVKGDNFRDIFTSNLYFDVYKLPWDLQKTVFSYWDAVDKITGSTLKQDFLDTFDEDGDGVVTYDEFGKKGITGFLLHWGGMTVSLSGSEPLGYLKGGFITTTSLQRYADPTWNVGGYDITREYAQGAAVMAAMRMSNMEMEMPDPFCPQLTWGKGKWPSPLLTAYMMRGMFLYGPLFPGNVSLQGLYGTAFTYADLTQNGGRYTGFVRSQPTPDALARYFEDVRSGKRQPLGFTFYVPAGFGSIAGEPVLNVAETVAPDMLLSVTFSDGEKWP